MWIHRSVIRGAESPKFQPRAANLLDNQHYRNGLKQKAGTPLTEVIKSKIGKLSSM